MFRVPQKLIDAMEKLVPILVRTAADQARKSGNPMKGERCFSMEL